MKPDHSDGQHAASLRIRILFGEAAMLGPGKADLLERIRDTGSIAGAGRAMAMSYKRAWSLVEELNAAFREPLVERARGGAGGGGARLTPAGAAVLAHYRKLEAITAEAGAAEIEAIRGLLSDMSSEK
ncbi:winged helix-turn-helix domain-containing protein [Rhodosalinus halophilus]|nr:LysR family transcriptional regulator [Rhodosalinus halophilus]